MENINDGITIGQLLFTGISVVVTVLIPVISGLFSVLKSINKTNTRLNHLEKSWENAQTTIREIPVMKQRVNSLEHFKRETDPAMNQMVSILATIDGKLDLTSRQIESLERRFEHYDKDIKSLYKHYGSQKDRS